VDPEGGDQPVPNNSQLEYKSSSTKDPPIILSIFYMCFRSIFVPTLVSILGMNLVVRSLTTRIHSVVNPLVIYSIVRTFLFKLPKFRASTLMNICPYKGETQRTRKWPKWYSFIHCFGPNSELIFDLKKLAQNLDNHVNVVTIKTVKHYGQTISI